MSTDWLTAYATALSHRDAHEKANERLINAYTALADHSASISARAAATSTSDTAISETAPEPIVQSKERSSPRLPSIPLPILRRTSNSTIPSQPGRSTPPPAESSSSIVQLRADLIAANRARAELSASLASTRTELASSQAEFAAATASLGQATRQRLMLERRIRDQDSELVERKKLLGHVQDEMVGLEMQMNVAEEEKNRVRAENEELVKRLVKERERIVAEMVRADGGG